MAYSDADGRRWARPRHRAAGQGPAHAAAGPEQGPAGQQTSAPQMAHPVSGADPVAEPTLGALAEYTCVLYEIARRAEVDGMARSAAATGSVSTSEVVPARDPEGVP